MKRLFLMIVIVGLATLNPVYAATVLREEQIEDAYVKNTSDTMTGDLVVNQSVTADSVDVTNNLTVGGDIDTTGDVGGTTIGSITEANLLDKSAVEVVSGAWDFSASVTSDYVWVTNDLTVSGATHLPADAIDTITEIKSTLKSGSDGTLITGTKGTNTYYAAWNADGDLVDGTGVPFTATITGVAKGDCLYYDGSNWVNLGKGAAGEVLSVSSDDTLYWKTDSAALTHYYEKATVNATQDSTEVIDLAVDTYTTGNDSLSISVNGQLWCITTDYTETDSDTVTFVTDIQANDIVIFRWFK